MSGIIINILRSIFNPVISQLPVFIIPDSSYYAVTNGMQTIFDFLAQVNFLIPLDHICVMLTIDFTIRFSKLLLFISNWVIRRVCDVTP